ncbi:MAG: hypothetical protein KDA85_17705, partial [Planctomycetaceae bacterium]|nr:hypothetical protein [Planctomycetaceae bacterium]
MDDIVSLFGATPIQIPPDVLFAGLATFLLHSTTLLLLVTGVIRLRKRSSAALRHRLWALTLICLPLLLVLPMLLPQVFCLTWPWALDRASVDD